MPPSSGHLVSLVGRVRGGPAPRSVWSIRPVDCRASLSTVGRARAPTGRLGQSVPRTAWRGGWRGASERRGRPGRCLCRSHRRSRAGSGDSARRCSTCSTSSMSGTSGSTSSSIIEGEGRVWTPLESKVRARGATSSSRTYRRWHFRWGPSGPSSRGAATPVQQDWNGSAQRVSPSPNIYSLSTP